MGIRAKAFCVFLAILAGGFLLTMGTVYASHDAGGGFNRWFAIVFQNAKEAVVGDAVQDQKLRLEEHRRQQAVRVEQALVSIQEAELDALQRKTAVMQQAENYRVEIEAALEELAGSGGEQGRIGRHMAEAKARVLAAIDQEVDKEVAGLLEEINPAAAGAQ